MSALPILYSFRRCPYAIRARYTLAFLNISVELREVVLKKKPEALLSLGGRSTVPQLLDGNSRYPESIDIIRWGLQQACNTSMYKTFYPVSKQQSVDAWLFQNDFRFKPWLDKYKYADRYPEFSQHYYRQQGERFLRRIEYSLMDSTYLLGNDLTLADVLVFPFIRQFRGVDSKWFDASSYKRVKLWLESLMSNALFEKVMIKHLPWEEGNSIVTL